MESDLNEEIQKLKDEGNSLRKIAATLHLSHEAVRKRLKNLADKEKLSTKERNEELTASAIGKEKASTGSNAHKSRASKRIKDTVNQVSTQKTPSLPLGVSVNPSRIASGKLSDCKKRVFQEVLSECGDLLGAIKELLEDHGIELYRMQVGIEGYQVEHNGQIIRLYVQRNKEG